MNGTRGIAVRFMNYGGKDRAPSSAVQTERMTVGLNSMVCSSHQPMLGRRSITGAQEANSVAKQGDMAADDNTINYADVTERSSR